MILMTAMINACGAQSESVLSPEEFAKYIQTESDVVIIDVRTPEEFSEGHIAGAINIDVSDDDFTEDVEAVVSRSAKPAVYCRSGRRSADAARTLQSAGYNVRDLDGGVLAWEKYGLPLTTGPRDIYTTPEGETLYIEPLIHASIRITYGDKEIEIDPVGKMGDRTTDYSALPKADLILVTHEHYDHLDPEAIKTLSKADTLVVANPRSAEILGYGKALANGDRLSVGKDIQIEAVPAYNTSPDKLQFHPKGRDNGYVLTLGGLRIYVAGDTEVVPEMSALKDIDIAFLPCNLPYTMTPDQLVEAAEIIRPKVVYPYHYGETDLSSITPRLAPEGIYVRICPFDPGASPLPTE